MTALPHRFGDRTPIGDVRAHHDGLPAGERSGASYRLAGRVIAAAPGLTRGGREEGSILGGLGRMLDGDNS